MGNAMGMKQASEVPPAGKKPAFQRRFWILSGLLAVTALFSVVYLYPTQAAPQARYAEALPRTLLDWTSRDLPVDEDTIRILETDDVLMREYARPGEPPIGLSVVFAKENRKVAHPPEVCLTGSGFEVREKSVVELKDGFKAVRLVTFYGDTREVYYYWYKSGEFMTESYLRQQANIALNHLLRKNASASLIRVSTLARSGELEKAEARVREFSLALLPYVQEVLP
jgi:EpsI family protein